MSNLISRRGACGEIIRYATMPLLLIKAFENIQKEAKSQSLDGPAACAFNNNPAPASGGSTLLNGLTAYFPLSDLTDATGGASLTNVNTVTFVAGKVGNCANFVAASTQRLTHADQAAFQMGTGPFTIACWFKTAAATSEQFLVYGNTLSVGYGIEIQGTAPTAAITDGTHADVRQQNAFNDNAWHLAVMVADRGGTGNFSFYVDNKNQQGSTAITTTGSVNISSGLSIGARTTSVNFLDGNIDEVGFWNRALTGESTAVQSSPASGTELYKLYNGTGSSGGGTTYPFTGL